MPPTAGVVISTVAGGYQAYRAGRDAYEALLGTAPYAKKIKLMLGEIGPEQMPDAVGPSSSSIRIPRSRLSPGLKREVSKCCEALFEEKYISTTRALAAVATAATGGVFSPLNDFSQGTGPSARVGSQIKNVFLIVNGNVQLPPTAGADVYRLSVIVDHEAFGGLATQAMVFETATVDALPNFQARSRFRVLVDQTIPLTNPAAPAAGAPTLIKAFEMKIPLGFKTNYNGNAGTIADVVKNSIILAEQTLAGNAQSMWHAQVVFLDA